MICSAGQEAGDRHEAPVETDLLLGLAQRGRDDIRVARLEPPAREADLPGVVGQMRRASRQQDAQPVGTLDEGHQHGRGDRRALEQIGERDRLARTVVPTPPIRQRFRARRRAHPSSDEIAQRDRIQDGGSGGGQGDVRSAGKGFAPGCGTMRYYTDRTGPRMQIDPLSALSPVDGRYAHSAAPLRDHLSEAALIRARIRVEAAWLLTLARTRPPGLPAGARPSSPHHRDRSSRSREPSPGRC